MSHDTGMTCLCVSDHRPAPLELHKHHLFPVYLGGDDNGELVWLCPTAHVNVHELLRLMLRDGGLSWAQAGDLYAQPVSRYAYALASRAYQWYHHQDAVSP